MTCTSIGICKRPFLDRSLIQNFRSVSIRNMRNCSYALFLPRDQWMFEKWAKWWARLYSATCSREINYISSPREKEQSSKRQIWHSNFFCLVCACLSETVRRLRPGKAVQECFPKSLAMDFEVKNFDGLLEKPFGVMARWWAGARKCKILTHNWT